MIDPAPAIPEPEEDEQEAVEVEPVDSSPEVASTASPDASPAGGYLSDPEMAEEEVTDEIFDYGQYARKAKLLPLKVLWKNTHSMGIPHIDLSKGPDTFAVLDFIYAMQRYHVENQALMEPILIEAYQGKMEREWCASVDFDFTKVMSKLVKWMTNRKDWLLVKLKLEEGVRLNDDLEKHLKYFGMIAKYAHMEAESDRTKRLLLLSLGGTVRMSEAKDDNRKI